MKKKRPNWHLRISVRFLTASGDYIRKDCGSREAVSKRLVTTLALVDRTRFIDNEDDGQANVR
jgi:hypothetical protein